MPNMHILTAREERLMREVVEALFASLDLQEALSRAYGLLSRLIGVDHGALCISKPELPEMYDWAVAELPGEWFGGYAEMAPHDFVRKAVMTTPDRVLRDSEMGSRPVLKKNFMYHRSRELGLPIEQVMAVLLSVDDSCHGGVTLYRAKSLPFSDRDRAILQELAPSFATAMRHCRLFGETRRRANMLDALLRHQGSEAIFFALPATEVARTTGADALLARWFSPSERGSGGVPTCLLEQLRRAASPTRLVSDPPAPYVRLGITNDLQVHFLSVPDGERKLWALVLKELQHSAPVPSDWRRKLTPRELEVVSRVLLGWDNALIAQELNCAVDTIKKHLQHIFDKLGVSSRAKLMALARRRS